MKNKVLFSVIILITCFSLSVHAQDKARAKAEKSITWYGIDFTISKFTLVTDIPSVIVNQHLKSINMLIQMEPEKYDLKKWFDKNEVTYDIDQVNEKNSKINQDELVIGDEHKISLEDVKGVIAKYNTQGKPGLGLIFVAENLNKVKQTGSYYVCFFDQSTKEIVDAQRFESKAVGIGFRNYWAGSVYNIMKIWLK